MGDCECDDRRKKCEPKKETAEIKEIILCKKDDCGATKKIPVLASKIPDDLNRLQVGNKIYTTRMWMAKANQDLDGPVEQFAKSYDELEGSYKPNQQLVVGFHKGFSHDQYGELTAEALKYYKNFVCGVVTQDIKKIIEDVKGFNGSDIQYAGVVDAMNGNIGGMKSTAIEMTPAYREFSDQRAAEFVELYLRNLNLDVPFVDYQTYLSNLGSNSLKLAKSILEKPNVQKFFTQRPAQNGIYTAQNIFRGNGAGVQKGPLISQLFWANINGGVTSSPSVPNWKRVQKYWAPKPLEETSSAVSWGFTSGQAGALLNGLTTEQYNGGPSTPSTAAGDMENKFIYNGRSLAAYVTEEPRAQAAYDAALILGSWMGQNFNPGLGGPIPNQRDNNTNAHPSSPQTVAAYLSDINNTLVYYWKWFVNRSTRSEAMGLYVDNQMKGVKNYDFPLWFIERNGELKDLWDAVVADNAKVASKYASANQANLSPDPRQVPTYTYHVQTRPGNPRHSAYPAGHSAAVSGLFAAKFFYNTDIALKDLDVFKLSSTGAVSATLADDADLDYTPVGGKLAANSGKAIYLEANSNGSKLLVKFNDDATWTVGDEINKMASNIAHARDFLGMHYRAEDNGALYFCEEAVIRYCKDLISIWGQNEYVVAAGKVVSEKPPEVPYTKYDGTRVVITPHHYV